MKITRRDFARTAGAAAVGVATLSAASMRAQAADSPGSSASLGRMFPSDFKWGCATAAYQIEGAVAEDGRRPSIWDTFSHTPGKTAEGATADIANDHYHLYKDDVRLMKTLGVSTYRFSIAWPRVFPSGTGAPNPKGLAFYDRLVDELLESGIEPYATLYHWDLPQALQDSVGGWQSRDTSMAFADYAGYTAGKLSDRVRNFFTINEMGAFVEAGHIAGVHAPGLQLSGAAMYQTRHNAVLGHGLAVQAIRASAAPDTRIGLAENMRVCCPVIESDVHIAAAREAARQINAAYMTVIQEGAYTDMYLATAGKDAPRFTPDELKAISSPLDFVGINVYQPTYVRADESAPGYELVPMPTSFPHAPSPWLFVGPEALYWGPRHIHDLWKVKDIYITENGCSAADVPDVDGKVYDLDRVAFLRNYLSQLQRATSEGVPVKGYFLWSLMDNFEWADGFSNRFGIYHVDYATQMRRPKLSADFYREVIRRNAVV